MKDEGLVSHLACCDLDAGKLKELLSWARVCEMLHCDRSIIYAKLR